MLYAGSFGISLVVSTSWDLTSVTGLTATIERPDASIITKFLTPLEFDTIKTSGKVNVPIEASDLTMAGVYHIQLDHTTPGVKRFTYNGTFSVAMPLGGA